MIDVLWVGLSAKFSKNGDILPPLDRSTSSGKLLSEVENLLPNFVFSRTNLVYFPPLDQDNRLRYPTLTECKQCLPRLIEEIDLCQPKIVFLLGKQVSNFFLKNEVISAQKGYLNDFSVVGKKIKYVLVPHPSYILIYKRKEKELYIRRLVLTAKTVVKIEKNVHPFCLSMPDSSKQVLAL